jgi:hypothetical protein
MFAFPYANSSAPKSCVIGQTNLDRPNWPGQKYAIGAAYGKTGE